MQNPELSNDRENPAQKTNYISEREWGNEPEKLEEILNQAEAELNRILEEAGWQRLLEESQLGLALREALINAFKHGPKTDPRDPSRPAKIKVQLSLTPRELMAVVADQGPGFDPKVVHHSV